jgi:hypothetical protein
MAGVNLNKPFILKELGINLKNKNFNVNLFGRISSNIVGEALPERNRKAYPAG